MSENATYQRARYKHYIRYVALFFLIVVDVGAVSSVIRTLFLTNREITIGIMLKEATLCGLFLFVNAMVMPSIAMEADKIVVREDGLRIKSLLFSSLVTWSDIKKVIAPVYLKFAILKTPRFFHLINKRDIPKYDELIQTIHTRAFQPPE